VSVSEVITSPRATSDAGGRILRYTLGERINHWIAGLSYLYCLITGLAFWSPHLFWMAIIVGGGPTARFWHPWSGLVFTASVLWMYRIWRSDMLTTDTDRAWWKAVTYYVQNEDENLPPIGRFNYGQKMFFWLMFYGVILLLSGLALWFDEHSVESAMAALSGGRGTCRGCTRDHRWLYHSRLHGRGHGTRQFYINDPWRSFVRLGQDAPHLWYEQVTRKTSGQK
jgi:formate dehydrogenase gamma subunit